MIQLLEECFSSSQSARFAAADELWLIGANTRSLRKLALVGLRCLVSDPDAMVRNTAVEALHELGNRNDFRRLRQALSDEDWVVRASAASSFASIGGRFAVKHLARAVEQDEHPVVRSYAATGLGDLGDRSILPFLQAQIEKESENRARVGLYHALILLGQPGYCSDLAGLLVNEDRHIVVDSTLSVLGELIEKDLVSATIKDSVVSSLKAYAEGEKEVEWRREKALALVERLL